MSYDAPDWFDSPAAPERGLRFRCTLCGNCCTGPEGFVLFTDDEAARLAGRLRISVEAFLRDYTRDTPRGRSLAERRGEHGLDCVFLDRRTIPGKAVCGVYEDRPAQCRTWPFWKSVIRSEHTWHAAGRACPGINRGPLTPPQQVRILRDTVDI